MTQATPQTLPTVPKSTRLALEAVVSVVMKLRDPNGGCPWDLKQTHQSLRKYMLEEAYEAVSAIDTDDTPDRLAICDELGDVLLQVLLHAQVADDEKKFTLADVAQGLSEKLIRRHPHVFGGGSAMDSPEAVAAQWDDIKQQENAASGAKKTIWDEPPRGLPALLAADRLSTAAVKEGFKWPDFETLWACVASEFDELKEAIEAEDKRHQEEELGDLLFAVVSLAGHLKIDPEVALIRANDKFLNRYVTLKSLCDKPVDSYSFEALDDLWRQAKAKIATQKSC